MNQNYILSIYPVNKIDTMSFHPMKMTEHIDSKNYENYEKYEKYENCDFDDLDDLDDFSTIENFILWQDKIFMRKIF